MRPRMDGGVVAADVLVLDGQSTTGVAGGQVFP